MLGSREGGDGVGVHDSGRGGTEARNSSSGDYSARRQWRTCSVLHVRDLRVKRGASASAWRG
jgi:hypothetical protein